METFCPYCKTKYDVNLEDEGSITECQICHQEFEVRVSQGRTHAQKPNLNSQKKVNGKAFTFGASTVGSSSTKSRDIDFTWARRLVRFLFLLSNAIIIIFILGSFIFVCQGLLSWILVLTYAFSFFLVNYLVYNLLMLLFEIVRHLREIRDKK